jgi:hypothetical protein
VTEYRIWLAVVAVGGVLVAGTPRISYSARGPIEVTLPKWTDEDETVYTEPGSFFLGGGLLPGTGAPEPLADGDTGAGGKTVREAKSPANDLPIYGPEPEPQADGMLVYGPEPEPNAASEQVFEFVEVVRTRPEIPLPLVRVEISGEYAGAYFDAAPAEGLVDPQLLLSEFKRYDLEELLTYHEQESPYLIRILLFEGGQELPDGVTLRSLHDDWYGDEPVALLAYFMGQPDRAVVEFGRLARDGVSGTALEGVLESSVEQALVVENDFHQLERFGMELSVQLYWLERQLGLEAPAPARGDEMAAAKAAVGDGWWHDPVAMLEPVPRWAWIGGGSLLPLVLVGGMVRVLRRSGGSRGYLFPDYEIEPRLGGEHSGGGHGLMSFGHSRGEGGN